MNNIKKLREQKGITQCELASEIGVTQACIAQWETTNGMPRASLIPKIAKVLNCKIDDLFRKE